MSRALKKGNTKIIALLAEMGADEDVNRGVRHCRRCRVLALLSPPEEPFSNS